MSAPPPGILGYAYRRAGATYFSEADPRPIRGEDVAPVEWCTPVVAAPEALGAPADWSALQAAGRWVGAKPAASGEPVATHMQMMDHLESLKTDPATLARLRAAVTPHPAPARVPLTDTQIRRAVEAGWLAALKCHAEAGMAGWSAERETYIANAIEAACDITSPAAQKASP